MRRSEYRDHVLGAVERAMRELGMRPRPQVNMFADDGAFLGLVLAPDPAELAPADTTGMLGLAACTLFAARVIVLWDNADLPTLALPAEPDEAAILVLDAAPDGLWLSAHPYRAEVGPPSPRGLPTVVPRWRAPVDVDPGLLPAPVSDLLAAWNELPVNDVTSVCETLRQHGFVVTLTGDLGKSTEHPPGAPTSLDAAQALRAADRNGDLSKVKVALDVARRALQSAPAGDPDHAECLIVLSSALFLRFQLLGDDDDRRESLATAQAAVATLPRDSAQRPGFLTTLSSALRVEYESTGDLEALRAGRLAARESVLADPPTEADRPTFLVNHSTVSRLWYEATGDNAALDEAVAHSRDALESTRRDSPNYPVTLMCHAANLQVAFERDGDPALLDEAIATSRIAAHWTPDAHWSKAGCLANLSQLLRLRFRHTGELRALEDAISIARRAVEMYPPGDPDAGVYLSALASPLHLRYDRLNDSADLDESIETHRDAVRRTPHGHAKRPLFAANQASALVVRYRATGDRTDLDEAITVARSAAAELPSGTPARALLLSNLGNWLGLRFDDSGDDGDLAEAVASAEAAHAGVAPEHPDNATLSINLALVLCRRQPDEFPDRALELLEFAATHSTAKVSERVRAGMEWGDRAKRARQAESAARGFAAAVRLLPRLAPLALLRSDSEHWLATFSGLAGDAAACALDVGRPEEAIELLEQGRAVLLSHALGTRTDLSTLREHKPDLAHRFEYLCTQLEQDADDSLGADRHRTTADNLAEVIAEVRRIPGFERFLLPPRASDLVRVAADGPIVVVNTSEYRCDALIVMADGIAVCPLPRLAADEVASRLPTFLSALRDSSSPLLRVRRAAERDIQGTLAWLWDAVAEPVLDKLGSPKRMWWVPTGLLGFFPLHAAADPDTKGASVLDRVMSSYSPSLGALAHARNTPARGTPRMLVVAMPDTPNGNPLPGAEREATTVSGHFPGSRILIGDQATRDAVATALRDSTWVHFACHGRNNPDSPSDSRLLLHDHEQHPLDARTMSILRLSGAQFAFLSACQTAMSSTALPDESIHLAAAFHLAGFAHVIGTLWAINDTAAVTISERFYESVSAGAGFGKHVAAALHQAVLAMRADSPNTPSHWASHIHIGP